MAVTSVCVCVDLSLPVAVLVFTSRLDLMTDVITATLLQLILIFPSDLLSTSTQCWRKWNEYVIYCNAIFFFFYQNVTDYRTKNGNKCK